MPETESQPNGLLVPGQGVILEGNSIESSAGLLQEHRSGGL